MAFTKEEHEAIRETITEIFKERTAQQAAAKEVLAIKIIHEKPAFDGTFEILFMTREEADEYHKQRIIDGQWATSKDIIEEVSFAEGVELAKQPDCIGGACILREARRFQKINPVVQAMGLDI
ncbi:MAG: hypothetical protein LRY54_02220 [Alphaproteobacteria bacterium]|nr:hypothetical protein [Alphaproteobacteria bacterium]